jgi:hypothetical protein
VACLESINTRGARKSYRAQTYYCFRSRLPTYYAVCLFHAVSDLFQPLEPRVARRSYVHSADEGAEQSEV